MQQFGEVVTYEGKVINAFFHANSGGMTENVSNVWGGKNLPYLQPAKTDGEDGYTQYSSQVVLSKEEFIQKLKGKYNNAEVNFEDENWTQLLENTPGERVGKIKFGNIEMSGVETRTLFGLKSAKFTVSVENNNIKFDVIGYGHGVGLSQTGADAMAKQGKSYSDILTHFYTETEIFLLE